MIFSLANARRRRACAECRALHRGAADDHSRPSSQNSHAETVLVRCAQSKAALATPLN